MRREETLGRLGGDEFGIIFADTSLEGARVALERLLAAAREESCARTLGDVTLSLSAGLAQVQPDDEDFSALLERADRSLYEAKSRGRGVIVP